MLCPNLGIDQLEFGQRPQLRQVGARPGTTPDRSRCIPLGASARWWCAAWLRWYLVTVPLIPSIASFHGYESMAAPVSVASQRQRHRNVDHVNIHNIVLVGSHLRADFGQVAQCCQLGALDGH